eukprot:TRINITY_DN13430_c0_g1_i3.p1 TRINITY_DN13430_c0_g1~~TRINITY_DN13430_c0_g1_i3.p1  ORF type:complete len:177 (+),score=23.84 TRINITY_DN13430_c0_g1_i3:64-594(+)
MCIRDSMNRIFEDMNRIFGNFHTPILVTGRSGGMRGFENLGSLDNFGGMAPAFHIPRMGPGAFMINNGIFMIPVSAMGEPSARGMMQEEIRNLPTTTFQPSRSSSSRPDTKGRSNVHQANQSGDSDNKSCTICMSDFSIGENLRILPCFHKFHSNCVDTWLRQKGSCPICRKELVN